MNAPPHQETVRRLRQPAFSKELKATIDAGVAPNVRVHTGPGCWDRARDSLPGHRLVVPLDHECAPEDFDFRNLDGQDVLLVSTGDIVLARRVATRICECSARMVAMLHPSMRCQFFYSVRA